MKKHLILLCLLALTIGRLEAKFDTLHISEGMELIKISPHLYVHNSEMDAGGGVYVPCSGMLYVENGKAFLFDTPANDSLTKILVSFIIDKMKLEIVGFIPNDWHRDSMGGLGYLQSLKIPNYAHQMTCEIAKEKKLPIPKISFNDNYELMFEGNKIECYYFGPAHTKDGIVVWLPNEKVLFADCMVKEVKAENLGYTADGDVNEYENTLQKVKSKFPKLKYIVPGHGDFGGIELLNHSLEMAKKLKK